MGYGEHHVEAKGRNLVIEVCVDHVDSALAAQAGGADRVELCDNLMEGGTTPSAGMLAVTRSQLKIGLHVIIRPRGGDFCYSDLEMEIMRLDIIQAKALGVDGIVVGLLTPDAQVDTVRTAELIALARPMRVTFHRAFDMVLDPRQALEDVIALGCERVLTSGLEASAWEGIDQIEQLLQQAGDRIIVMPAGGVGRNLARIASRVPLREVHLTATTTVDSAMQYRNSRVFMGGAFRAPEWTRSVTDPAKIRTLRDL